MSWVDASASAAASQTPIGTLNAGTTIDFGNGLIDTPTTNSINPATSTSAVAALGSAADQSPVGVPDTGDNSDTVAAASSVSPVIIIAGVGVVGLLIVAVIFLRHKK
jgi:hypothetical protein